MVAAISDSDGYVMAHVILLFVVYVYRMVIPATSYAAIHRVLHGCKR